MTSALTSRMGTNTGPDAADAQAGFLVAEQPYEEVGALTASGGPSALDDQSTTQLVVGEPVPLLEVNARTGRSTDDPVCGIGIGEAGDPMFTLQAGKQHGVAYDADPARPVAVRGRDGGAQAELGGEPVMNALRAGDGGSSRQPTVLAYEVDKERGVANDEGVKVTETDVAPPLLADGDPAERTDRGVRIVQPFRKSRRAASDTDDETWVAGEIANTLNTFDGGDVRASEVVVEVVAHAASAHTHTTDDGVAPAVTGSKQGPGHVAVPVDLKAATKTDHRTGVGTVGAGVGEDGDPAYTLTSTTPGAVGTAAVRRLTPLECERLQGVPDLWTKVPGSSDSSRYKELGNAVCAAVSMWLAWRIQAYRNGWRPA